MPTVTTIGHVRAAKRITLWMKFARAVGGIATVAEKFWSKMKIATTIGGVQPAQPITLSVPTAHRITAGTVPIALVCMPKPQAVNTVGTVPTI